HQIDMLHFLPGGWVEIVVIAPFAESHLLADEIHAVAGALADRDALAVIVDGDCGLMGVFYGPDDVLRPPRRVAAEEDAGAAGLERDLVHLGHVVLVEFDAEIALDPGKRVILADRKNDVVAGKYYGI